MPPPPAQQYGLFDTAQTRDTPRHILSWGLGVDSTAIILRWIHEPASRDFDLADLAILTAHVGDEWNQTARDCQEVILPLLAAHNIRYIQAARSQRTTTASGNGVRVLSDTRAPETLHSSGDYTLSDELLSGGTVPQLGAHRCSARSKAAVLEPIIARITAGRPYRHYMGYEANEARRSAKDTLFNTTVRTGAYPLQNWGWTRTDAAQYILAATSRVWAKSACVFCPFAIATAAGRAATLERMRREPDNGAHALWIEHTSICLNERQALMKDRRLLDVVTDAGLRDVLDRFTARLAASKHAVYHVRRLTKRHPHNPAKPGLAARSVRAVFRGTPSDAHQALRACAGTPTAGADGITRMMVRARGQQLPRLEEFYVAAPAVVEDKARPGFESAWADAVHTVALF